MCYGYSFDSKIRRFFKNLTSKRKDRWGYDDGIDFQWGEKYIRSSQVIPGVGGKYWRDNGDGTMTMFSHPTVRFRAFVDGLHNNISPNSLKIDEKNYTITFSDKGHFLTSVHKVQESDYLRNYNHITVKRASGLTLVLDIDENVLEDSQEIIRS